MLTRLIVESGRWDEVGKIPLMVQSRDFQAVKLQWETKPAAVRKDAEAARGFAGKLLALSQDAGQRPFAKLIINLQAKEAEALAAATSGDAEEAVARMNGLLAPTGRFNSRANTNVGSGYWTYVVSSGQTFYLTGNKATAISAFQMNEFHGTQQGTQIHPGQTLNLDYSLTQAFPLRGDLRLQLGLVGYDQWQTTDKSGPTLTPAEAADHYKVYALGFATNLMLPERKASVGIKYFHEFDCRSTFQGYTLQISGAITF